MVNVMNIINKLYGGNEMQYLSTRGDSERVGSAQAIKQGLAVDGGLFVPEKLVEVPKENLRDMQDSKYTDIAKSIFSRYLTDYTADEIEYCVTSAYNDKNFDHEDIAPLSFLKDRAVLELWHGPTCAFKDMALQILPYFLVLAAKKTGEKSKIVILVATSGDTGKAAMEGFKDVEGTNIVVFFPEHGVSEVQKLQMLTQEGNNINVVAVEGNFDDCQSGVKEVFSDKDFNKDLNQKSYKLSSANSINWGRLIPQVVYYFSSYAKLVKQNKITFGDKVNFVVPTGNFGNILAGYYAMKMGLPVNKLICAANSNNVLTDFIRTGIYDKNRDFLKSISPSMDILISSNLERLLFDITGDSSKISKWMSELQQSGKYEVDNEVKEIIQRVFWSNYATDEDTMDTIKKAWKNDNYLIDTHTAVAWKVYQDYKIETGDKTYTVILSTASPFKFNASVAQAILADKAKGKSEFELLDMLSAHTGWQIPEGLKNLDKKEMLHSDKINSNEIKKKVADILGV